ALVQRLAGGGEPPEVACEPQQQGGGQQRQQAEAGVQPVPDAVLGRRRADGTGDCLATIDGDEPESPDDQPDGDLSWMEGRGARMFHQAAPQVAGNRTIAT